MSGEPTLFRSAFNMQWGFLLAYLVVAFAWGRGSYAHDISDLLEDPLRTRPPVLNRGSTLPGDAEPILCPTKVDLSQPLGLVDAIDLALCNNAQIRETWAEIKIQAGALGEARSAYLPIVSTAISTLYTKNQFPNDPAADSSTHGHTLYGNLNWRLFDFGTRAANREAAGRMLEAALAGHDAALQKALAEVIGAYFDAMTAQGALQARTQATALAQSTLTATETREAKGAAATSDTLQASTALAKAKLEEHRAEGEYRKALAVLVYTIGLSTDTTIVLPAALDEYHPELIDDLAQWLRTAEENHPSIAQARLQWEAAQSRAEAARAEGLPTLDFATNYYQNGYPNQGLQNSRTNTTTVGVSLSIPLFEGFARTYKVSSAKARVEQSEAQWQDTEHEVLTTVVKAHADAMSALGNLQSSDALLQAAQAAMASAERRYAHGAADILEILNTQNALADAQQERIRCLAEWRSARLRLLANAGVMGRTAIVP